MSSYQQVQSSVLPPAVPAYILRGHTAQIHALHFFRQNLRLLSGDAEGWIVMWDVPVKRPAAVWRAYEATILGIGSWGADKIITHGRDNSLRVWQVPANDEKQFSTTLPIDDATTDRKKPWLLHDLPVNALNFCSFASIPVHPTDKDENTDIIIAVPGLQDGSINITSLPSEARIATVPPPANTKTGMLMAIALSFTRPADKDSTLVLIAGYESGHVARWTQTQSKPGAWQATYVQQAHTQPVLSVAIDTASGVWLSSSADAIIGKHPLTFKSTEEPVFLKTKHAGQQDLCVRSDGKIFATAGWDGRGRVYDAGEFKELAVLKWHKEGMYAAAFAQVDPEGFDANKDAISATSTEVVARRPLTVAEQRVARTQSTHYLAAGSKDGKVSLWDIY